MIVEIDLNSDEPIYVQLKNAVIKGIASGKLKPGEHLPSVRQFAEDLGINMHTVNKAYGSLKQDGFIIVHRKKGVVVNNDLPDLNDEYIENLKKELQPIIYEAACRGMKTKEFQEHCNEIFNKLGGK